MVLTNEKIVINIEILSRQVIEVEKKIDKMFISLDLISKAFGKNDVDVALLTREVDLLKELDLPVLKQRMDDLIKACVFDGVKGGLAFNKLLGGTLAFVAIQIGVLLLLLFKMFSK